MKLNWSAVYPVFLLLILIPIHASWTWKDQAYQANDAGFYMEIGQEIYIVAREKGLKTAAQFAYLHRHWKPLLGPSLIAPFLAITEGDTREAFRIYSPVTSAIAVIGLYFLLGLFIARRSIAFWGTAMIAVSAWMVMNFLEFGSEIPWLMFSIWFLYALVRNRMVATWYTTLLLALAILCRPVETTFTLGLAYLALISIPVGRKKIRLGLHFGILAAETLATATIMMAPYFLLKKEYPLLAVQLIAAVLILYAALKYATVKRKCTTDEQRMHTHWTLLSVLVLLWFLPGFQTCISWIISCTVGRHIDSSSYYELNKLNFVLLYLKRAGFYLLVPLAFWPWLRAGAEKFWRERQLEFWFLLWTATGFAAVGSLTESRDFRYYHVPWIALAILIWAPIAAAATGRYRRRLTAAFVTLTALMAIGTATVYTQFGRHFQIDLMLASRFGVGDFTRARTISREETYFLISNYLEAKVPKQNIIKILEDPGSYMGFSTNPWKHTVRSRERGLYWTVEHPFNVSGNTEDELIRSALESADYLFAGVFITESDSNYSRISKKLFSCIEKDCPDIPVEFVGGYNIPSTSEIPGTPYVLFKRRIPALEPDELFICYRYFKNYIH